MIDKRDLVYKTHLVDALDTDEEIVIKELLQQMERSWRAQAQPLIDRLVAIRMATPPKYFYVTEEKP